MKFSRGNKTPFFIGVTEVVRDYFAESGKDMSSTRPVLVKGIFLILVFLVSYAGIFISGNNIALILLCYITIGITGVMLVFNIVHDASHNALFRSKKMNNAARYLGDIAGINTYIWDIRHNKQHHSFTNVLGGDLIIENIPLIRLSPHQPRKKFHKFQPLYAPFLYMFYSFYWIFVVDFRLFLKKEICNLKNISHPQKEWVRLILFKAFYVSYIIVLPWLFTPLTMAQVLILFMLMHMVGGLLLSFVAVLGHFVVGPAFPEAKEGIIENSWGEHELEATIDFAPSSKVIHWITGGLNTHTAHHLFPRMCHAHYYAVTPIIEEYCKSKGYPYRKESFAGAIVSHFRYLRRLGVE